MDIQTIEWRNNKIRIINQAKLPLKLQYLYIKDIKSLRQAIRTMKIRGAPALAAAASLGIYLGIRGSRAKDFSGFSKELESAARYIASSRPTARNLFWAIERVCSVAARNKNRAVSVIKKLILEESNKIIDEDKTACRRIGRYGARLIRNNDTILTICNAGKLATIDYGTALGVIDRAEEEGKHIKVYVCETRPMLQGARITTWELNRAGIDVTLICDNMAATLMRQARIDKIITGADRVALNGDAANKIGTYNLAVLAKFHKIPFYVAAPSSTFDTRIKSGHEIPIEQRKRQELTELFFKTPIALKRIKVFNPAFDVTPGNMITAIITDKGIIYPPYRKNIKAKIKE